MPVDLYLKPRGRAYQVGNVVAGEGSTYERGERIAKGGNAVVHACVDEKTGDEYAIKFQLRLDGVRVDRFNRERNILQSLSHEHLLCSVDSGESLAELKRPKRRPENVKLPFVVMELGERNLAQLLREQSEISYDDYIGQFRGLAHALAVLHEKAIHRDIKPSNILIKGETWLISDFGLCALVDEDPNHKLSIDGEVVGPMNWMSPEESTRLSGFASDITESSDVFQLASLFWLVVTRRHPSGIICRDDWTGPPKLFEPLSRALQHEPMRRFANGSEFAAAIISAIEP